MVVVVVVVGGVWEEEVGVVLGLGGMPFEEGVDGFSDGFWVEFGFGGGRRCGGGRHGETERGLGALGFSKGFDLGFWNTYANLLGQLGRSI